MAAYWDVSAADGTDRRVRAGWSYPKPTESFSLLAGWISVYLRRVDRCRLEGEDVLAQPGEFYGDWISPLIKDLSREIPNIPS